MTQVKRGTLLITGEKKSLGQDAKGPVGVQDEKALDVWRCGLEELKSAEKRREAMTLSSSCLTHCVHSLCFSLSIEYIYFAILLL